MAFAVQALASAVDIVVFLTALVVVIAMKSRMAILWGGLAGAALSQMMVAMMRETSIDLSAFPAHAVGGIISASIAYGLYVLKERLGF